MDYMSDPDDIVKNIYLHKNDEIIIYSSEGNSESKNKFTDECSECSP